MKEFRTDSKKQGERAADGVDNLVGKVSIRPGDLPKVSIIIPSYNTSQYIAITLDSVFSQTFRSFEVIVVNDGSPDTSKLERTLRPYLDRMVYIKQENAGPSAARNRAIRQAHGKYIAFLDSDDAWFPIFLESQMKLFGRVPSPDMVCADLMKVVELRPRKGHLLQAWASQGSASFEDIMMQDRPVVMSSVVVRSQAAIEAGLFDERLRRGEDYDLWLRIAHRGGRIRYQRRVLGQRLIRRQSLSADSERVFASASQILLKLGGQLDLTPERQRLLRQRISDFQAGFEVARGKRLLLEGQFAQAEQSIRAAATRSRSLGAVLLVTALRISPSKTRALVRAWTWFYGRAKTLILLALAYAVSW
jgi:Glycosyl transferase family 2